MNRRERVAAALAGEVPDRIPVSAWGHTYEKEWFPRTLADTTIGLAREFDWDWVKIQNRETCFAEALGAIFRPDPSGATFPITVKRGAEKASDWLAVIEKAENPELAEPLQEQIDLLKLIVADLGPDWPVLQTVFSPLSVVGYLVGRDQARAVKWLDDEPELMARVLDAIAGMLGRFTRASIEAGAAGIFYAIVGYASDDWIPEPRYREEVLPSDLAVLADASGGWFNMAHLCFGNVHFEMANDLPVHSLSWSTTDAGNPSLAEAAALTTKTRVGGLGRRDPIATGTAAQTYAEARAAMDGGIERGLMLAPGCSVSPWPWDLSDNFVALRAAVEPL